MMRAGIVLMLLGLGLHGAAGAQESRCGLLDLAGCKDAAASRTLVDSGLVQAFARLAGDGAATIRAVLEDPATLNAVVRALADIPNLTLRFKTFQSDEAGSALGLSFDYTLEAYRSEFEAAGTTHAGYRVGLDAAGEISFDSDVQPRDFLTGSAGIHLYRSSGGAVATSADVARALDAAIVRLSELSTEELNSSKADELTLAEFAKYLTTQVYVDFALAGAYEGDQGFDARQVVGSAQLVLDVKAWSSRSFLAHANVLDWPFALLRVLTGVDDQLTPRGSAIPTLLVRLSTVDPIENSDRALLGGLGPYWRFNLETGFRTLAAEAAGQSVFFEAGFRYYRELGASAAIHAANLDSYRYFVAAFSAANGMYVSYSTGRLPFDVADDQVYEIGFKYSF